MPTSVLLAVLAAAGLLALAPALTRRHDASVRVAAERATSTARVLPRSRRRRTVPGRRPVNPPTWLVVRPAAGRGRDRGGIATGTGRRAAAPGNRAAAAGKRAVAPATAGKRRAAVGKMAAGKRRSLRRRRGVPTALHRRRRVLLALVGLNLVELTGALVVGPGFWIGFAVSFTVLLADLAYLRHRAVVTARRRALRRRRLSWIAAEQAAVRRQQARRAVERRAAVRSAAAERDAARRRASTEYVQRWS